MTSSQQTDSMSCTGAASSFDSKYYEQNYPSYEKQNPTRKLRHYATVINRHLSPGVPRRIHDVGCAFGKFVGTLGCGWEAYGSDVSEFAIEQAREKYPHGTFRVADGAGTPVFPEKFGVVTAFDVLEHVAGLDALGQSIHDQLLHGGLFVFVVPVYDGLSGPLIRFLDKDPTHVHKWPRESWLEWAATRFTVVEWHGILRYLLPWSRYLHRVTRRFRRHTPAILIACKKA